MLSLNWCHLYCYCSIQTFSTHRLFILLQHLLAPHFTADTTMHHGGSKIGFSSFFDVGKIFVLKRNLTSAGGGEKPLHVFVAQRSVKAEIGDRFFEMKMSIRFLALKHLSQSEREAFSSIRLTWFLWQYFWRSVAESQGSNPL